MAGGMPWFRVDPGWRNHPKVKRLRMALGVPAVLHVMDVWCFTAAYYPSGKLPVDGPFLEQEVGWTGAEGALVAVMTKERLLDVSLGGFVVHGWREMNGKQFDKFTRDRKKKPKKDASALTDPALDPQDASKESANSPPVSPTDSSATYERTNVRTDETNATKGTDATAAKQPPSRRSHTELTDANGRTWANETIFDVVRLWQELFQPLFNVPFDKERQITTLIGTLGGLHVVLPAIRGLQYTNCWGEYTGVASSAPSLQFDAFLGKSDKVNAARDNLRRFMAGEKPPTRAGARPTPVNALTDDFNATWRTTP